jgi:hypothetical protein
MRKSAITIGCAMLLLSASGQAALSGSGTGAPTPGSGGAAAPKLKGVQLRPIMAPIEPEQPKEQPGMLKGGTTVYQQRDPRLEIWRASQLYQQGSFALYMRDPYNAAECFKQSGDAFEGSIGEGRFLAESRFAEAQCRRLMGQIPQSARLFQTAVDIFRRTDPYNPYLFAGVQNLRLMGFADKEVKPAPKKKLVASAVKLKLQELKPQIASIDRTLKGGITKLEDGTLIASLQDEQFFDGSKKLIPKIAGCDISDKFLKGALHNAFIEMTCLEFAALGANYLTAPDVYKPFLVDGKPVLISASEDAWSSPTAKIGINGQDYNVSMTLPGINKHSHNVALVTDGQHVLALDPRKNDVWKLVPIFKAKGQSEFNWWKLTHIKKASVPVSKKKTASPFAR